jgi:energy-coupling factor transport system permease protein
VSAQAFDPRAKGLCYLLATALTLAATELPQLLALVAAEAALLVGLRLTPRWLALMRALLPTLLLFALVTWLTAGAAAGVGAALRLLALTTAGVLFFATTPPEELGEALQASGLSPQTAFLFEGTMRFVPTMGALMREVYDAQASRGIRLDGLYLLRNGPALLAPLLISALRLADELTEAMEARGFRSPRRTLLRDYRWRGRDWLLVASTVVASALFVAWLAMT